MKQARSHKKQRNQQIVQAHISHGYTLKEIADYLGIHYSTVSRLAQTKKLHCKT
ncbi:MAG: helix-turn-helix domain-containing protein [Desulfurivibrio sp.]|nr:MAG: helix-turn-helix domain-containing protein [Desulfurivibrio sp.]